MLPTTFRLDYSELTRYMRSRNLRGIVTRKASIKRQTARKERRNVRRSLRV